MQKDSRYIVVKTLCDIEENKSYSNLKINEYFKRYDLNSQDRGFATEILYGTIRWKLKIDYCIQKYLRADIDNLTPWVRNSLRIAVYQIYFMDKVPEYAAVNQSVDLVKYKEKKYCALVNAVLRNIIKNKQDFYNIDEKDKIKKISIEYSHPQWLVRKLLKIYDEKFVIDLMDKNNTPPKLTIRVNTLKCSYDDLKAKLESEGAFVTKGKIQDSMALKNFHLIEKSKEFNEGLFTIQDESSMLAVKCLNPMPGDTIMDLCSAPGGKSTYAAQLMKNKGEIIAFDIYEHKINLINNNAERLGINIIKTMLKDATIFMEEFENYADKVIVDAPCSGLGLIRKKPEIRWNFEEKNIRELKKIQYSILENASKYVKIKGCIIYSTCSITVDENEDIIKRFLKEHENFKLEDISEFFPEDFSSETLKSGFIKLFPNINDMDGFFIAKLIRKW